MAEDNIDFNNEEVLEKAYDSKLMIRLLKYAKPYWKFFAIAFVMLLASTLTDLIRPILLQIAIDDCISKGDAAKLSNIGMLFIGIILLGFIFNFIQIYTLTYTGQTIIYNLRQQIFTHLQKMSISYFDRNPVGRLVTRVTNDTETLNDMYTNVLVSLLKDISILLGVVVIMFRMNVRLSLVVLSVVPILIPMTIIFRRKVRSIYREVRVKLAKINSILSENISGIRIIQIFNSEKEKLNEFEKANNEYKKALINEVVVSGVFRPSIEMLSGFCIALIVWYAGGKVIDNTITFGVLYAFVNYIGYFFQPVNDLAEKYNILQSAMASSERIFSILDTEKEPDDGIICNDKKLFKGDIEFKNVWFAYKNEDWVLKDVSFSVPSGKTVAIVGATGAGKTSIINLINRFYEIQKGEILIDGIKTTEIKKEWLRKNIGVVLQDVFLFGGTIKDNIRLNEDAITDDAIKKASEFVNAARFIEALPNKYEEEVMERGATFSSGQRQLLSFARTLAFDPSILILDEATASIDTETELLIQDALSKLTKDKTTIIIAHRLSTIQHADNIIVLHKGRIREMGNHQELLAKKGMYYNLYQLQYSNIEN
jgi:ATP-binding cassette subfamily B multidrug efflux pump